MRDAQQKATSRRHQHVDDSRLLLDLTYGVLADIEAEDLCEALFAQGLRAMIGGILTVPPDPLISRAGDTCARVSYFNFPVEDPSRIG